MNSNESFINVVDDFTNFDISFEYFGVSFTNIRTCFINSNGGFIKVGDSFKNFGVSFIFVGGCSEKCKRVDNIKLSTLLDIYRFCVLFFAVCEFDSADLFVLG